MILASVKKPAQCQGDQGATGMYPNSAGFFEEELFKYSEGKCE